MNTKRHNLRRIAGLATLASALLVASGCNSAGEGALSGGALGAGAGAIIGSMYADAGKGALIGMAAGAVGGAILGDQNERNDRRYQDRYYYDRYERSDRYYGR